MKPYAVSPIAAVVLSRDDDETSQIRRRPAPEAQDARMPIDAAVAMHQIGQYQTALDLLAPFLDCGDRAGSEALWLAALCHVGLGQHADAVRCLELALMETSVHEASRVVLLYELGSVLETLGDHRRARECFRAVCRRAPWFRDAAARAER
jgi:tetratricopeptide (TPR) repeat protein